MNEVKEYYNSIATDYDHDRFANSYGKFIDTEERIILQIHSGLRLRHRQIEQLCNHRCRYK